MNGLRRLIEQVTPGPWQADDRGSSVEISSIEFHVCEIDTSYDVDYDREQVEADVRLITLAPEMAALLCEMGDALARGRIDKCDTDRYCPPGGTDIDVEHRHRDDCLRCSLLACLEELVPDGSTECPSCKPGGAHNIHFDRTICACGAMHYYCNECGRQTDPCHG